jgi:DNA polymerase-3 subunit gamma/tau
LSRSGDAEPGSSRDVDAKAEGTSGGIDTAALRRVWPDVLARIFSMRRVTWTFLSQHAQVLDYDGDRLVLGIATVGLANTFRAGNHAELVRQALIDEIGVDVPVEGRPIAETGGGQGSGREAPSASGSGGLPRGGPGQPPRAGSGAPLRDGPGGPPRGGAGDSPVVVDDSVPPVADWPEPEPEPETPSAGEDPRLAAPEENGHAAVPAVARANRASSPAPGSAAGDPAPRVPSQSATARHNRAPARDERYSPDDAVSDDDEDVATSASSGRAVIEKVLGGQFLGELED